MNARTTAKTTSLRCPMCGSAIRYRKGDPLPEFFPFCSARCKMADLHNWLHEKYVLWRELTPEEQEEVDFEDLSREDLIELVRQLQARRMGEGDDDEDLEV